jgi:hypothetical protein
LTSLEVGAFQMNPSTTPDGKAFITAYDPVLGDSLGAAQASVERNAEINEFLATQFGPYPFESQGGVSSPSSSRSRRRSPGSGWTTCSRPGSTRRVANCSGVCECL